MGRMSFWRDKCSRVAPKVYFWHCNIYYIGDLLKDADEMFVNHKDDTWKEGIDNMLCDQVNVTQNFNIMVHLVKPNKMRLNGDKCEVLCLG